MRLIKIIGVGINQYANLRTLSCCVNDVSAFLDEFSKKAPNIRKTLLGTDGSKAGPTKADIEFTLAELSNSKLARGDLAAFFFAGHGYSYEGKDYLAAFDTDCEKTATAICTDDVLAALRDSGAGTSIVFVDACRNELSRGISRFGERTAEIARRQGTIVFFSCAPGEISHELPILDIGHGVFTYAVLTALRTNVSATPIELERYIGGLVSKLCTEHKLGTQLPYVTVFPIQNALLNIFDGTYKAIAGPKRKNMIVIVGPSNAGKTTLGQLLSSALKYTHIEMSSFAWQKMATLPDYRGNIQEFMENVVWKDGNLNCIAADMLSANAALDNVIVCGPRRTEEIETIFHSDWRVIPFFVYANSSERYRRFRNSAQDRYYLDYKEFVRKDMKEYSWGLASIAHMRDFEFIVSEGKPDELASSILARLASRDINAAP